MFNINRRPVLSAEEIYAHYDLIVQIDKEIEYMSIGKKIAFTPEWHNRQLAKLKKKYNLTKEEDNAIESFYDMYFSYIHFFSSVGKPIRASEIREIVLNQLYSACVNTVIRIAEENGTTCVRL